MNSLFTRTRGLLVAMAAALSLLVVASCGGGSSSSGNPTTYASVAMAGELIDYTLDPTALTYSYTIVESQFGLTGKTGSGTLTRNADGTYTPSGVPDARIAILPNGLLLGAVRENVGAGVVTIPIIGLANPVTTGAAMNGAYNYLHRGCLQPVCATDTGTFVITASASSVTWTSCTAANLAAGACPAGDRSGTMTHLGGGRWRVNENGAALPVGTAIAFASAGQNVLLIDLKDLRPGGLGIGMVVGAQQATMTAAQTDGTWIAATSLGHWAVFDTSGTNITVTRVDGFPVNVPGTFTMNTPWTGMATTDGGGVGFLAGSGVYVLETGSGHAELGIKIR
jgi:hypothetical protein